MSNLRLALELEACQALRVCRAFCKGEGRSFIAVGRNGLFP